MRTTCRPAVLRPRPALLEGAAAEVLRSPAPALSGPVITSGSSVTIAGILTFGFSPSLLLLPSSYP